MNSGNQPGVAKPGIGWLGGMAMLLCLMLPLPVQAATGVITTVAGNGTYGYSGDGGPAMVAQLNTPNGIAVDGSGNLYIADTNNNRIRKVDAATGTITTVAGNGTGGYSGDGGPATAAELNSPHGVAVDGSGNLYITDTMNCRIRKVDAATGTITTVAGNGTGGYSGDGGSATAAELNVPFNIALDGAGNLYIADTANSRIREVDAATGTITTVAGIGTPGHSGDGGAATAAELGFPAGVAVDGAGNLYIADMQNDRIRKVDAATGIITTVAGTGTLGYSGDGGPATAAGLSVPYDVALDGAGNLYIADTGNSRIRKVDAATGTITTVAGTGTGGYSGDGGPAASAQVNKPQGVALDGAGNLYVADTSNYRIRKVVASGQAVAWGLGGMLGDGTNTSSSTPVKVSGLDGVVAISGFNAHSLALKPDGTVWAWGYNDHGQLGDGTTTNRTAPVQVSGLGGVVAVSGGHAYSMALKSDGTVWAWGQNNVGQLGNGTTGNAQTTPVQVSGLSGVIAIAGGSSDSLALKSDGTVWAWGQNDAGQLGDGTTASAQTTPMQVTGLSGVVAIANGDNNTFFLALESDGTVWAWGRGVSASFSTTFQTTPVKVSGLSGVTAIADGNGFSLALESDGTVWAWGQNGYGQLGDGTTTSSNTPVKVSGLSGVTAIAAGSYHSLAVKSDGTAWAWGWNMFGQFGDGTTTSSNTPVQVSGLSGATAIAGGFGYSVAISATSHNHPPTANAGAAQTVEATGATTAVTLNGSASSDSDGDTLSYNWSWNGGSATGANPTVNLAIGTYTIMLTVNDGHGNTSSATTSVIVHDTTKPVLTLPLDVNAQANGNPDSTVNIGNATATDAFSVTISNNAPAAFPLGTTLVTWTATDANGNVSTGTQNVTVVDTTPPSITAPADILNAEANAVNSTVVIGTATGTDLFGPVTITSDAPATFPLGTTTVTWTATDANGNHSTATQKVTVADTTPPVMSPPNAPSNTPLAVDYKDFCNLSAMTLSGSTIGINPAFDYSTGTNCVLRLTNNYGQSGGGFVTNPVSLAGSASFSTAFSFQISNSQGAGDEDGPGADGFVFVMQTQSNQYGGAGVGIGYAGIQHSVGIEFDTYNNGAVDGNNGNHVGININGAVDSVAQANIPTRMNNGAIWHAWVDYNGATKLLEVRLSQTATRPTAATLSYTVDLPAVLGQSSAYVGFTSGTGAGMGVHDILSWQLTNTFAPISTAPGDVTVEANAVLSTVNIGTVTATDIFGPVTVTNDAPAAGFPLGTTVVTWKATDANGNSSTATQNVTVVDTTPPTLNVPPDVSAEANGVQSTVDIGTATGSDIFGVTFTNNAPATFPLGTTTVTWTATDGNGWTTTGTQKVTVADHTPPTVTPPANITVEATGSTTAVTLGSATATDLVDGSLTATPDQTGPFTVGVHTITWSATDSHGNTGTATQTVTVTDHTPPTVTAPANVTLEATGPTTAVTLGSATATDLVDGSLTPTPDVTGPFAVGVHTITWSATDAHGNTGTATQTVTVTDHTPPTVTAPANVTVEATGPTTAVTLGSATATDLVDGTLTATPDQTGPFAPGTYTITWSATDAHGNTGTATQTVTVTDHTPPVITVPADVTAEATGPQTTVSIGTATATDLVDGTVAVTNDAPATFPLGTTTVTYTAVDAHGNKATATQTVTVKDTTPPAVTAPADVTVEATGPTTAVTLGSATATDLVDGTVTATPDQTGPFAPGTYTITWSATDAAGNTGTATQTVTVTDHTPPVLTAPANVTAEANGNPGSTVSLGTATAVDLVDGAVAVTNDAPATFPLGTTVVTYTAKDSHGNKATATQTVIVQDTTPPKLTLPVNVKVEATGPKTSVDIGTATGTDLFGPVSITSNAPATYPLGTTTVTWTATDANGNSSTGTQTVTVVDTTPPTVTAQLVPIPTGHGESDEHRDSGLFKVVFSASDLVDPNPTLTATLNGATVSNGQIVKLERGRRQRIETDDGRLEIKAPSFTLNVTATDFSGNVGTGSASYAFPVHHEEHEDNGIHRGNDKAEHHVDEGKHKSEHKAKIAHKKAGKAKARAKAKAAKARSKAKARAAKAKARAKAKAKAAKARAKAAKSKARAKAAKARDRAEDRNRRGEDRG